MAKAKKGTIKIKPENRGKLRSATHTKKGDKIPLAKEEKELHSGSPAERKRANFAINARKWKHK
jgi:hypothetical protein